MKNLACNSINRTFVTLSLSILLSGVNVAYSQTDVCAACGKCFQAAGNQQDTTLGHSGDEQRGSVAVSIGDSVYEGWNLLSAPLATDDMSRFSLFPAGSAAFTYEGGTYRSKDTLNFGNGYWLKFLSDTVAAFAGNARPSLVINVSAGWNMIGSLYAPVFSSEVMPIAGISNVSLIYGYNGGYFIADTIMPGKAYWIWVNVSGSMVLTAAAPTPAESVLVKRSRTSSFAGLEDDFSFLKIADAAGRNQKLYCGSRSELYPDKQEFILPPLPPEGGFDARFSSQRMVETYDSPLKKPQQFRIDIMSTHYPLTISWELKKDTKERFILTDIEGGKLVGSVVLNEKGSIKISDERVKSLMLRVEKGKQLPTEFALRQNYPNPFNPSATIEFDLPKDTRVTLKIFDIVGREVATLKDNEAYEAGTHQVEFNASSFASGVYFYRISVVGQNGISSYTDVKKMVLLR